MIPKFRKIIFRTNQRKARKKNKQSIVQSASSARVSLKIRPRSGQCQVNTAAVWCRQAWQRHSSYNHWAVSRLRPSRHLAVPTRHTCWDKKPCLRVYWTQLWESVQGAYRYGEGTHFAHFLSPALWGLLSDKDQKKNVTESISEFCCKVHSSTRDDGGGGCAP